MAVNFRLHVLAILCLLALTAVYGCRRSSDTVPGGDASAGFDSSAASVKSSDSGPPQIDRALAIGDPAPPLAIARWITGPSIAEFEPGQVYVIEFWATWCPPCRTSMPHLSQLQQQYGDQVQIVGITRESERTVQDFLDKKAPDGKSWAETVTYRLALDADDETNTAYMQAAGQRGIPTAFVVGREGLLDWIGHPMTMDGPLAQIVAGQWDRAAAIAQMRQRERLEEVSGELDELLRDRQWDAALAVVERLEEDLGASSETVRMRVKIMQRAGRSEAVSSLRGELVELLWDDALGLNELAWDIATRGNGTDLGLALKAALRGSELTNHQDAAILDTVARVYYEQGQLDEAVQWQRKAVQYNRGQEEIDAALRKYLAERQAREENDDAAGGSDGA